VSQLVPLDPSKTSTSLRRPENLAEPMRSLAFTRLGFETVLRKACQVSALEPGIDDSAMSEQILSAPASPLAWP
jgi:hypothetical protein